MSWRVSNEDLDVVWYLQQLTRFQGLFAEY